MKKIISTILTVVLLQSQVTYAAIDAQFFALRPIATSLTGSSSIKETAGILNETLLACLIRIHGAVLTEIQKDLKDNYRIRISVSALSVMISNNKKLSKLAASIRQQRKRKYSTLAEVLEALTQRTRNGLKNTKKGLTEGPWRDWTLYDAAVKDFGISLPIERRYPTALSVQEKLARRKSLGLPNFYTDLTSHPNKKYRDAALAEAARRFNIILPLKRKSSVLSDKGGRIGFSRKILTLTHHLAGRVTVRQESKSLLRLVDVNQEQNYMEMSAAKEGISIRLSSLRHRQSQECRVDFSRYGEKKELTLSDNPLIVEFVIRLFWMKYPESKLTQAIMNEIRATAHRKPLAGRTIMRGLTYLYLPHLYEDRPGIVTVYRDSEREPYFIALEETANPENFIIFYKKGDNYYILSNGPDEDTIIPREGNAIYPLKTDRFKKFDVEIARPTASRIRGGNQCASLGQAMIVCSSANEFMITRRQGAIMREEEWSRDTIVFTNPLTNEKITEITRVGDDEFQIEGLELSPGRPLIVKTDHINLSTIVWSFPKYASVQLKKAFYPTEEAYFGGSSRIVRYELVGDKLIRKDYVELLERMGGTINEIKRRLHIRRRHQQNNLERPGTALGDLHSLIHTIAQAA